MAIRVYSPPTSSVCITVPAAPSNLVAVGGEELIDLTWTDNSAIETGFELERSLNGLTSWIQIATPVIDAASESDTGLIAYTTYFYRIRAMNGAVYSPYSLLASDMVEAAPPVAIAINGAPLHASLIDAGEYYFSDGEIVGVDGRGRPIRDGIQVFEFRWDFVSDAGMAYLMSFFPNDGIRSVEVTASLYDDRDNITNFSYGVMYQPEVGSRGLSGYHDVVLRFHDIRPTVR